MSNENQPAVSGLGKVEKVTINLNNNGSNAADNTNELTADEQANISNGLNKDGTAKAAADAGGGLTEEQKQANIAAGKNEDGSAKVIELTADQKAANVTAGLNEDGTPKANIELSDEELKAQYEKRFPTTAALTDEEKTKQALAFEKRMLDLYVEGGGTIEQFALVKQIASADLTELSVAELKAELKAKGITDDEQVKAVIKERYYQLEQAEIDAIEDEDEKALAQKKFDYGKEKFENKGKNKKQEAVDFLDNLTEAVKQKDHFTQTEKEFSSNVDEHFKNVERKITLQLGKVDDTDIAPVEYEVPEEAIAKAKETLKDPAKRKQLLFNTDGSLNLKNLAELTLKAEMFDSAAKTAYLTGGDRQVTEFEKRFPFRSATALGTGGGQQNNNGNTGKVASFGKNQKVKPAVNQ